MGYNKDLITPLLFSYSTNYTTSHTLTHCNINEASNSDEQIISAGQSRWNPTREQMMVLEEVYRSGTRTPTTQQIHELASKLQKYGRIEGKNVFYWFQNHKSRERLKRRRPDHQEQRLATNNVLDQEPLHKGNLVDSSVLRRRGDHGVIHTKSFLSSSPKHPQNNNNDDDDGKIMEEYERGLVEEKETTWENQLGPVTSLDCTYQMVITSKGSQEAEHHYHNLNEEEEEARKSRTLDLFPVTENQEKTDVIGLEEKNTKPNGTNQMCCNYYCYYEFMPLMN